MGLLKVPTWIDLMDTPRQIDPNRHVEQFRSGTSYLSLRPRRRGVGCLHSRCRDPSAEVADQACQQSSEACSEHDRSESSSVTVGPTCPSCGPAAMAGKEADVDATELASAPRRSQGEKPR